MKYFAGMTVLSLIVFVSVLSNGCASKERKDSPLSDNNGVLLEKEPGVCLDVSSGKMWLKKRGGLFSSFQEAEQYAAQLRSGGYDDWRLPTKKELFNLHYIFYWKKNGDCTIKRSGEYWALAEGEPTLGHWETYILCAPNYRYVESPGTKGYVRAIRE